jgi:hypothetical protein
MRGHWVLMRDQHMVSGVTILILKVTSRSV